MKIEPSKMYKTRNNLICEIYKIGENYIFGAVDRGWGWSSVTWKIDGTHESNSELDIVSLWETECPVIQKVIKCECGSATVGSSKHSTWCPKF